MKSLQATIQRKADVTELEKLQKKVEENEKKISELIKNNGEETTWTNIMDTPEKRTVEEVVEKSVKKRDDEDKERQTGRET